MNKIKRLPKILRKAGTEQFKPFTCRQHSFNLSSQEDDRFHGVIAH